MREIMNEDLAQLFGAGSILQMADLIGLQGKCISHRDQELNFVVTGAAELQSVVTISIIELDRDHTSNLSAPLFSEAIWYATPRFAALFDAETESRKRAHRAVLDRQRAEAEEGARNRFHQEQERLDKEWERDRQMLLDLPLLFERNESAVTPRILRIMLTFQDHILLRDDREAKFFNDMMFKYISYRDAAHISRLQAEWIKDILERSVGRIREAPRGKS